MSQEPNLKSTILQLNQTLVQLRSDFKGLQDEVTRLKSLDVLGTMKSQEARTAEESHRKEILDITSKQAQTIIGLRTDLLNLKTEVDRFSQKAVTDRLREQKELAAIASTDQMLDKNIEQVRYNLSEVTAQLDSLKTNLDQLANKHEQLAKKTIVEQLKDQEELRSAAQKENELLRDIEQLHSIVASLSADLEALQTTVGGMKNTQDAALKVGWLAQLKDKQAIEAATAAGTSYSAFGVENVKQALDILFMKNRSLELELREVVAIAQAEPFPPNAKGTTYLDVTEFGLKTVQDALDRSFREISALKTERTDRDNQVKTFNRAIFELRSKLENLNKGVDELADGAGNHLIKGDHSWVIDGNSNSVIGNNSLVIGGKINQLYGDNSLIGSGEENELRANNAGIVVARKSKISAPYSLIGSGEENQITQPRGFIGSGLGNAITMPNGFIGSGVGNIVAGESGMIGAGKNNSAGGEYSAIPGGIDNQANGRTSVAMGMRSLANHDGSFLWHCADSDYWSSLRTNEVAFSAAGGFRLRTNLQQTTGLDLPAGGNAFVMACPASSQAEVENVDGQMILSALATVPVRRYQQKQFKRIPATNTLEEVGLSPLIQFLPSAEDWDSAFAKILSVNVIQNTNRSGDMIEIPGISQGDILGVLMVAVQELYKTLQDQAAKIVALEGSKA